MIHKLTWEDLGYKLVFKYVGPHDGTIYHNIDQVRYLDKDGFYFNHGPDIMLYDDSRIGGFKNTMNERDWYYFNDFRKVRLDKYIKLI